MVNNSIMVKYMVDYLIMVNKNMKWYYGWLRPAMTWLIGIRSMGISGS